MDVAACNVVEPCFRRHPGGHRGGSVFHEVLPDSGPLETDVDTEVMQVPHRTDSSPQEHRRRMDSAAAENNLVGFESMFLAALHRHDADRLCSFK